MEYSKNFGFYLPSAEGDDVADINQISNNFQKIDEELFDAQSSGGSDAALNGWEFEKYDEDDVQTYRLKANGKTILEYVSVNDSVGTVSLYSPQILGLQASGETIIRSMYVEGRISCGRSPEDYNDLTTKGYVDGLVGDISSSLDELHEYAQALVNGGVAE